MKEEHSNHTEVYTRELGGIAYTTADYNKLSQNLRATNRINTFPPHKVWAPCSYNFITILFRKSKTTNLLDVIQT
jgi:hypothetical protein